MAGPCHGQQRCPVLLAASHAPVGPDVSLQLLWGEKEKEEEKEDEEDTFWTTQDVLTPVQLLLVYSTSGRTSNSGLFRRAPCLWQFRGSVSGGCLRSTEFSNVFSVFCAIAWFDIGHSSKKVGTPGFRQCPFSDSGLLGSTVDTHSSVPEARGFFYVRHAA